MKVQIRKAQIGDLNSLTVLKQQVWISTYATEGLTDEFSGYVLFEYSIENVRKSICDKNKLILLVLKGEHLIGCLDILLTAKRPVKSIESCIEIAEFYILEKFQNQGIGKKLLSATLNQIKTFGFDKVWLTVYYKNRRAIDFYVRQNFIQIGETDFILGKNKHKNYIMIRDI